MHVWQFQEAKAKLTQLINEAEKEPQVISHRGVPKTVIMSIKRYRGLTAAKNDIVSFFRSSPLYQSNIKLARDNSRLREVEL